MTEKNPDDSVHEEQFGTNENVAETENDKQEKDPKELDSSDNSEKPEDEQDKGDTTKEEVKDPKDLDSSDNYEPPEDEQVKGDTTKEETKDPTDLDSSDNSEPPEDEQVKGDTTKKEAKDPTDLDSSDNSEPPEDEQDKGVATKEEAKDPKDLDSSDNSEKPEDEQDKGVATKEEAKDPKDLDSSDNSEPPEDEQDKGVVPKAKIKEGSKTKKEQTADNVELPPVDYSGSTKQELIETLVLIIENRPPAEIRNDVDRIKILFYKKIRREAEERKSKFLESGGKIEDYRSWIDPDEARVKHLLDKYREKKTIFNKIQETEKYENLKKKYNIIDQIKELVNREESINKTFHDFRSLQNDWHSIGIVPQSSLKDLWENYHHAVEIFYDYIKINKELRDLDLKKNLEAKLSLCEKAEELLLEPSPVNAFRSLQDFHNQWREIGPVPLDSKNDIWDRFKEATAQINIRHHEYFEKQKDEQRKNLDAKIAICEEVEAVNLLELKSFKDFDDKAFKVVELQKMWRTIGFAPKKQNIKVYQRFRDACDTFFDKKRGFYADNKEIQLNNLQLKLELCVQAEALQESTDWKTTSDALIKLQKKWKAIGPVPRKQSERSWKRFRKACDHFFNKKSEYFSELDNSYEDNLKTKQAIIDELEKFEPGSDVQASFEYLKELQRKWTDIGFVPFNKKDEITNKYRDALNKEFDKLKIDDEDKSILKYRNKLDSLKTNPKSSRKIRNEREKFLTKIKQLESDIVLWENNIGFFAKSSNADAMIKEVEEKIENGKKLIKTLEEKVKMIDQSGLDE